jgi:hypothetical protein
MLSVKLINQFLHIPEILRRFPASPYVTAIRPLNKIMELPVVSIRVEDPVNLPFVSVNNDCWLQFRWQLGSGRWCIVVEQRDVENVMLPDCMQMV